MERAVPVLPADDLTVARDFYVRGLGFSVRFEASEDGRNGIMGLERGTIYLTIDAPTTGRPRGVRVSSGRERGRLLPGMARPRGHQEASRERVVGREDL